MPIISRYAGLSRPFPINRGIRKKTAALDFAQFKPARFEFEKKDNQINMRVPKPLLAAVKARARARGIPSTRFMRETLESALAPK